PPRRSSALFPRRPGPRGQGHQREEEQVRNGTAGAEGLTGVGAVLSHRAPRSATSSLLSVCGTVGLRHTERRKAWQDKMAPASTFTTQRVKIPPNAQSGMLAFLHNHTTGRSTKRAGFSGRPEAGVLLRHPRPLSEPFGLLCARGWCRSSVIDPVKFSRKGLSTLIFAVASIKRGKTHGCFSRSSTFDEDAGHKTQKVNKRSLKGPLPPNGKNFVVAMCTPPGTQTGPRKSHRAEGTR